jgi:hypothetical protein
MPLVALVLVASAWGLFTLLARRLPSDSLLRALLLRTRLSLVVPLGLGGGLIWLLGLLPAADLSLPSPLELRRLLLMLEPVGECAVRLQNMGQAQSGGGRRVFQVAGVTGIGGVDFRCHSNHHTQTSADDAGIPAVS